MRIRFRIIFFITGFLASYSCFLHVIKKTIIIYAFLPGIVNVRLYPNTDQNDEQIFGHLNDEGFTISDKTAFHFTYGSFPTEEFTLLGIVTSVPKESSEDFDPLAEFKKGTLTDHESVENGFRGVFRGFDGMEEIIRTIRYPRVLVHPLLLYREATPNTLKRDFVK